MGTREIMRMIEFLKRSKKAQDQFRKGSVDVRYDDVMDEIHFISVIDDSVVTCKV